MSFDWAAIPRNVLARLLDVERRLDDLEGFAALPVVDPEGEGDTTYVSIVQEVEIGEGPDISITGTSPNQTIGRGGDSVLLFDSAGAPCAEYDADSAGLTAALAAMADGDVCELAAVTITGGPWFPAHGALRGLSRTGSVLDGEVRPAGGTAMENLTIDRSEDDAGAINGIVDVGGVVTLKNLTVHIENATGAANAIYMGLGGTITAYDCELLAPVGTDGFAAMITDGTFYQYGGRAVGTTPYLPYDL